MYNEEEKMYKKVVVFGGGTGISYLLKGLKDFYPAGCVF